MKLRLLGFAGNERLAKTDWSKYTVWVGHQFPEAKRLLKEKQASGVGR